MNGWMNEWMIEVSAKERSSLTKKCLLWKLQKWPIETPTSTDSPDWEAPEVQCSTATPHSDCDKHHFIKHRLGFQHISLHQIPTNKCLPYQRQRRKFSKPIKPLLSMGQKVGVLSWSKCLCYPHTNSNVKGLTPNMMVFCGGCGLRRWLGLDEVMRVVPSCLGLVPF